MSHVVLFKLTLPVSSVGPLPKAVLKRVLDHLHYFQATAKPVIPLRSKLSPSSYSARTEKSVKATVVLLGGRLLDRADDRAEEKEHPLRGHRRYTAGTHLLPHVPFQDGLPAAPRGHVTLGRALEPCPSGQKAFSPMRQPCSLLPFFFICPLLPAQRSQAPPGLAAPLTYSLGTERSRRDTAEKQFQALGTDEAGRGLSGARNGVRPHGFNAVYSLPALFPLARPRSA